MLMIVMFSGLPRYGIFIEVAESIQVHARSLTVMIHDFSKIM